ncbi:MAG: DNA primase [Deltaproteobacteria bacterium]|nr:DNA primase [Deltaproteobacteria bacterium]
MNTQPKSKVTAADLRADLDAQAAQLDTAAAFSPDLQPILDGLTKADIRAKAEAYGLAPNENLTQKIVLVVAVKEMLRQAEAQGYGLAFNSGGYFVYCGGYWHEIERPAFQAFLTAAAIAIGVKPIQAQHFDTQDQLRKQFEATAFRLAPQLPPDKILINFRNGTLEVEGERAKLRKAAPADFLKYQLPYAYDPGASCPRFFRYLERVQPDESARAVLAEYVGYTLAPALNLQKVLVLKGEGSNGKSVFCEITTALLDRKNVRCNTMEQLTKREDYRATLANALLNYSNEGSLKLNSEVFKTLAAGERITARRLFGDPFEMEHYARLMFNCNVLPREVEQSEGFFRRFLIVPFNVKITDTEKDPQLAAKITATELPGVFNWILEGLRRLLKAKRFTDCEAARRELEEYRRESSSVLSFLEDCRVTPGTNEQEKESLQRLFACYRYYCSDNGHRFPVNQKTFAKMLRSQGFKDAPRTSAGTRFYCHYNQEGPDY